MPRQKQQQRRSWCTPYQLFVIVAPVRVRQHHPSSHIDGNVCTCSEQRRTTPTMHAAPATNRGARRTSSCSAATLMETTREFNHLAMEAHDTLVLCPQRPHRKASVVKGSWSGTTTKVGLVMKITTQQQTRGDCTVTDRTLTKTTRFDMKKTGEKTQRTRRSPRRAPRSLVVLALGTASPPAPSSATEVSGPYSKRSNTSNICSRGTPLYSAVRLRRHS